MNFISARPAISTSIGVIGVGSLYLFWRWYSNRERIPSNWRQVGVLNDLMCFPIKSCGIIREQAMECSELGLKIDWLYDRGFVIVNLAGNFVSARLHPKLVLIKPSMSKDELILTVPNGESFTIKYKDIIEKPVSKVTLWGQEMKGMDCGDDVAGFLSKYILDEDTGLRMVHYPTECGNMRRSRIRAIVRDNDSGAFPDLTSYCLMNESSIDDLNTRMDGFKTDPQNFRPNFVVKGAQPLEEDHWQWVRIGDVVFKVVKQCTRCVLTTVDWKTGVKNENGEPLATLKKYRMIGVKKHDTGSPVMGIHLTLRKAGTVQLSDPVYVA
ncbi:mitochondrial amidoxime reducing component [Arctopsyche grandis]|uniref:mitochondrial amidoxime reducing component n=1 Tax=Arctopsyche grandis TaxID=121162 RepID=UPI00406D70E2